MFFQNPHKCCASNDALLVAYIPKEGNCKSIMLPKWGCLERMCFGYLVASGSLLVLRAEGLMQPARSPLALPGGTKEYLVWHGRSRNLISKLS